MLPAHHLITSVHAHWTAAFSSSVPTIYPGMRIDTDRLREWCELWVDAWSDRPRRMHGPDELNVSILVHCFARHPTSKTVAHRLAMAAREALGERLVPVLDREHTVPVTLGVLRLREHSVQDLSRNHAALGQERLQHLVVVFQGMAQAVTA